MPRRRRSSDQNKDRPADLAAALHARLTGEHHSRWRERGRVRPIKDLVRRYKTQKAAAEAAGVNKGTLWRILKGASEGSPGTWARLKAASRQASADPAQMSAAREAADPAAGAGFTVTAVFTVSQDNRDGKRRTVRFPPSPWIDAAIDAWEAGDDDGANQALLEAMRPVMGEGHLRAVEHPTLDFY